MTHRFILPVGALTALASFALVTGCSSDATKPGNFANMRIVNASASTGPISALNENRTVQAGVAFQTPAGAGGCGTVEEGGSEAVDFVLAGTQTGLATVTMQIVANTNYTAVFFGPNNVGVFQEAFTTPSAGNNDIRFVNATGSAGDIYLTTPGATLAGTSPTISNLAAGQASSTGQFSNGRTEIRMFNVGVNSGTPRVDFTIAGLPNNTGTVVLTVPPAGQTSPTAFVVGSCAH
jgi:hypothetical protein